MATVGRIPTVQDLDDDLYMAALWWRDAASKTVALWDYIQPLGSEGLQGPPWNMDPAKADDYFHTIEYAATLAKVYTGQIDQSAFDFDEALAPARGGR